MFRILTKGLIIKGNKILLLKRSEDSSFGANLWDIPGGKLEFKETPEDTLIREIKEETDIIININRIINTSTGIDNQEKKQYISIIYLCDYVSGEVKLDADHTEFQWVDLNEIDEYDLVYYVKETLTKFSRKEDSHE